MVTINKDQELYVIPSGNGFSCLGFDVALARIARLGGSDLRSKRGTMAVYERLQALQNDAKEVFEATGVRSNAELHSQLKGLEGKRVEVVNANGETRRFYVGKSTGWIPCHLEIKRSNSQGGCAISPDETFKSVCVIGDRGNRQFI